VVGDWRRLRNEKLHNLYDTSNIIRGDDVKGGEMGGACSTHGTHEIRIQSFGSLLSDEYQGLFPRGVKLTLTSI
jgi:hypothetical protein